MNFYECLSVFPEGASSASRMALTARGLGYQGIIICNQDPSRIFMPQAAEKIRGIEVATGVEVTASGSRALKSRISALRSRYPFIIVRAASEEMVKVASEDPNVDLLIHPCDFKRPLTIATARAAKSNQICIGFDLGGLVRLRGSSRSRWMAALKSNLQIVRKFELHPIITASATSHFDLHSPRDLIALAEIAGFEADEAKEALRRPGMLLKLNSRKWVAAGVEIL
jgi:ribonuclease P/MRP protein subunit RPP1